MRTFLLLCGLMALTASPALADETAEFGDGTYLCEGGLTTAIKALERQWTPIGQETKNYTVTISGASTAARIEGADYQCQTKFFEFLGCTTGLYHFGMNIHTGRFTYDKSYGFIRGETPSGDAEIVTTTLGFCRPAPKS